VPRPGQAHSLTPPAGWWRSVQLSLSPQRLSRPSLRPSEYVRLLCDANGSRQDIRRDLVLSKGSYADELLPLLLRFLPVAVAFAPTSASNSFGGASHLCDALIRIADAFTAGLLTKLLELQPLLPAPASAEVVAKLSTLFTGAEAR
jgi:hypothetical protein